MRDESTKQKMIPLVHHMRRTGLSLKLRPGVAMNPAASQSNTPEWYSARHAVST